MILRTTGVALTIESKEDQHYVTGKRTGSNEDAHKKMIRKERELTKRVTGSCAENTRKALKTKSNQLGEQKAQRRRKQHEIQCCGYCTEEQKELSVKPVFSFDSGVKFRSGIIQGCPYFN